MLFVNTFIFLEVFLEAFPVSSSGHALLCMHLMERFFGGALPSQSYALVNHLAHGPIACAVIIFFMQQYAKAIRHVRLWVPIVVKLIAFGFVCDLVTGMLYVLFHSHTPITFLPYGFAISACSLYATRYIGRGLLQPISIPLYIQACVLGLVQACALFPGISRFGATYACARFLGIRSFRAFQLSFVLSLPVSIAGFFKGLVAASQAGVLDKLLNQETLLVMLCSGLLLVLNLNIMERIARNNEVWKFAWYLVVIAWCALLLI